MADLVERLRAHLDGDKLHALDSMLAEDVEETIDEIKSLRKDKAWRFEVCERLGISCAAGKEWTSNDVWEHVRELEEIARRKAESELSTLRARIEAAPVRVVAAHHIEGRMFDGLTLEWPKEEAALPSIAGKRVRLVVEE